MTSLRQSTSNGKIALTKIKVREAHDDDGFLRTEDDELYIKVHGNTVWGPHSIDEGSTGNIGKTYTFKDSIAIEVWEKDSISANDRLKTLTFGNSNSGATSLNFSGGGGHYTLWYQTWDTTPPPPPKYAYKPSLQFSLVKIKLLDEYYLKRPRKIEATIKLKCFGIANNFSQLFEIAENASEIPINQVLGSSSLTFAEMIGNLTGKLDVKIKENYVWYMPTSTVTFLSNPSALPRGEDLNTAFVKVINTPGGDHFKDFKFRVQLGYQYELHFKVRNTFNNSLYVSERGKVDRMKAAIAHYIKKFENYLDKVDLNMNISLEIGNHNPKAKTDNSAPKSGKTSKKIYKGKNVVVTKEGSKGKNLSFRDPDGSAMNREEFVTAIRMGLYPGYHIRKVRGIETPVSDPDNTKANNLG